MLEVAQTPPLLLPGRSAGALFLNEFKPLELAGLVQSVAAQLAEALLGRPLPRGCRSVLNRQAERDPAQFCWIKNVRIVRDSDALLANRGAVGMSLLFGTGLAPNSDSVKVKWWQVRETDRARARAALGKSLWAYSVAASNHWWKNLLSPFRGKKQRYLSGAIIEADGFA